MIYCSAAIGLVQVVDIHQLALEGKEVAEPQTQQFKKGPGKYDLTLASVDGRGDVMRTKASTIRRVITLTGEAQTFIVSTYRTEDGDFAFIEYLDNEGPIRLALPPKVCNVLARQRESLTTMLRRKRGKERAAADKVAGKLPGFMRNKGKE